MYDTQNTGLLLFWTILLLLKEGCITATAVSEMFSPLAQCYELYPLNNMKVQDVQATRESRIHNSGCWRILSMFSGITFDQALSTPAHLLAISMEMLMLFISNTNTSMLLKIQVPVSQLS